jgi:hypothetical protein
MARVSTLKKVLPALFGLLLIGGLLGGCGGTYKPAAEGQCNKGRTWVPPQKNESGDWTAGYCTWENQ